MLRGHILKNHDPRSDPLRTPFSFQPIPGFFLPGPSFSKTTEDHIYGLATDFTSFYTECFVIGSEQEKSRLLLLEATGLALTGQAVWVSVFVSVLNLTGG